MQRIGKIYDSDMSERTKVQQFFYGKSVFVTGGTGFIGALLIEKLLRCCPDVRRIYVLIREKVSLSCEDRLNELLKSPIFEIIKTKNPEQLKKLVCVRGNLEIENLGLSESDGKQIVDDVSCVFHVGASVKFLTPLRDILRTNVFGTKEVILLAKDLKDLKCFIHVSSTYSQCDKLTVDEIMYESSVNSEDLLLLAKNLGAKLDGIESTFLGKFPNTYTYSKFLAEDLLRRNASNMPVGVVRPAIVCQTWKDPLPGWADSTHSFSQLMASYIIGALHIIPSKSNTIWDVTPAEYVVNNIIAAAWKIGTTWDSGKKGIEVFHCSTSQRNPITTRQYQQLASKYDDEFPSNRSIWSRFTFVTTNKFLKCIMYSFHVPQMVLLSTLGNLVGKSKNYLQIYKKMHKSVSAVEYFMDKSWLFESSNCKALWEQMEERDKKLFNCNINTIVWDSVMKNFVQGVRTYTLKENLDTLPKAKFRKKILKIVHYLTIFGALHIFFKILHAAYQTTCTITWYLHNK